MIRLALAFVSFSAHVGRELIDTRVFMTPFVVFFVTKIH